jgi:hypothetical protein
MNKEIKVECASEQFDIAASIYARTGCAAHRRPQPESLPA